ncbi:MAG: rhodanese-like domain-containing protein [Geminicoccaceae bacterium]
MMMQKRLFLTIAAAAMAFGISGAHAGAPSAIAGAITVDADTVITMLTEQSGTHLIDSRKTSDYDAGHIEGAVMITNDAMTEDNLIEVIGSHDAPVIFYCNGASCGRAADAAEKAVSWGFTKVHYYYGGVEDWKSLELPLISN